MSNRIYKGVTYNPQGEKLDCLFCRITSRDPSEPSKVVLEDSKYMSFVPLHGASLHHLLVAPKHHIQNVESLKTLKDVEMLKEMIQFGKQALKEIDGNMNVDAAQFCFHVPPYNSIDHLHLHAVGNPQSLSFLGWLKYFPDSLWCKTAQKLIHELEESQT